MQFVDIKNDIAFIKEAENLDDEGLKEAYEYANKNTWTKEELDAYDYAAMREQDEKGRIAMAVLKAEQKAKEDNTIELVIEMHIEGISIPQIAKITKLASEQVTEIIENNKNK